MPELPEVESLRRYLKPLIEGQKIVDVAILRRQVVKGEDILECKGGYIGLLERWGKWLTIPTDRNKALYFHMGMTGTLSYERGERQNSDDPYYRVIFMLEEGMLIFKDLRALGRVHWGDNPPWGKLGPDPVNQPEGFTVFWESLHQRRSPIKVVLQDQSVLAGLGNIYAAEALFQAHLHPLKRAQELSYQQAQELWIEIGKVLHSAIEVSGTTIRDWEIGRGRLGGYQKFLQVYGRAGEPCFRCGTTIQRIKLLNRSTYFCPGCQL